MGMSIKYELQNIISGNGSVGKGENIQAINRFLRREKAAISPAEKAKFTKVEEAKLLTIILDEHGLWYSGVNEGVYIGEGAEQRIYEFPDPEFVLKLNDGKYYEYWEDYLNNLLLHNYFFPHLAYELLGFRISSGYLEAVVKQPYVRSTEPTDVNNVREFLASNGFLHKKNNDYYNPELGIILEDLHDENVITAEGSLQFIDTVFYITDDFYL